MHNHIFHLLLEIDVRFTSVPVAVKRKDKGSIVSLFGCVLTSSVSLKGHTYWLVNNDDERKKSIHISLLNSTHYVLSSIVFFEKGFYQCRVFDPERMKTPVDSKNATTINIEGRKLYTYIFLNCIQRFSDHSVLL